jgi:hypothetical protein
MGQRPVVLAVKRQTWTPFLGGNATEDDEHSAGSKASNASNSWACETLLHPQTMKCLGVVYFAHYCIVFTIANGEPCDLTSHGHQFGQCQQAMRGTIQEPFGSGSCPNCPSYYPSKPPHW